MDFMAMKRSQLYGMANNPYSTPQQPGAGPYPPSQTYTSPPPHRYPMSMQGRGQMAMGGMQYPQQQVCQQTQTLVLCTSQRDSWMSQPPLQCRSRYCSWYYKRYCCGTFASRREHSPAIFPWRLGMFNLRRSLKYQAAHLTPWHVVVSLLFITQFPLDSHWSYMGLMLCVCLGGMYVWYVCKHVHSLCLFDGALVCFITCFCMLLYVCVRACLICFFFCMRVSLILCVCMCVYVFVCACVVECSLHSKHRHSTADPRHSLSVRHNRPVLETMVLLSALLSLK